jgi:predicted SnoaL-like aldol condensation-catalyzing enzyme
MNFRYTTLTGFAGALLCAAAAYAQPAMTQVNPAPGCSATPAQIEANKKVAMAFFTTRGADRVALIDPSYKQHNPVFVKRAAENKVSDYEEFKSAFMNPPGAKGGPGQGQGQGQRRQAGGPPSFFEVVTAECDIVTLIHKMNMQDADGKPFEFFTFDTFRVKDGKLTEHWDGSMLPQRRPQGQGQAQGQAQPQQ